MKRNREKIYLPSSYPVDEIGFPVHPYDVNEQFIPQAEDSGERYNNHHRCFFSGVFGRLAISQAFRDLESMQISMVQYRHQKLHQLYTGIKLPSSYNMLNRIEEDMIQGRELKIFDKNIRQYVHHEITDDVFSRLKREYDTLNEDRPIVTIL